MMKFLAILACMLSFTAPPAFAEEERSHEGEVIYAPALEGFAASCGGTLGFGSVVDSRRDDGSGRGWGQQCGAGGAAKKCASCIAQWSFPSGAPRKGGRVECRCVGGGNGTPDNPSQCGGTERSGKVVHQVSDNGSGSLNGLFCGQANGSARRCGSCLAKWTYPSGQPRRGGKVNCTCVGNAR